MADSDVDYFDSDDVRQLFENALEYSGSRCSSESEIEDESSDDDADQGLAAARQWCEEQIPPFYMIHLISFFHLVSAKSGEYLVSNHKRENI
ncbi:hypothetical protein HHI36_015081 [Cryptolaemus montrouzieri]|uniref:Uncharacterized protein n=1 Tax=Cryptolaemus montrouzieri TaxID=559131 RepID=A0ABD2N4J3_9CUCU